MKVRKFWYLFILAIALGLSGLVVFGQHTPVSAAVPSGSISGTVWQDFCKFDCAAGTSLARGNGLVNINKGERRLAGIKVGLAKGKCAEKRPPKYIKTNLNGYYLFKNLPTGFYCVSVDSRQSGTAFPKPGYWTRPRESQNNAIARYELKIIASSDFVNKSFGWNYK